MLGENCHGDYEADAARYRELGKRSDGMGEKDDEISHLLIMAKPGIT